MSRKRNQDSDEDRTRISSPGDYARPESAAPLPEPEGDDRTRISAGPAQMTLGPGGVESAPVPPAQGGSPAPLPELLGNRMVGSGVLINNNYRIQRMLSAGGMGEVYKAENVFTGDPVAVKIVLPSLASDDGIIQLFKREARILGQLNDSAIVRYHNFVLDQGLNRYCLIMEYIEGNTLWDQVDSFGPITVGPALNLIGRLAHGLSKAHSRGVTHRDLSPDNVMLRGNRVEEAVLIDFGIARAVDFGEGTLAGRFAGKFKYVSPEQLGHFGGEIGPAADIYGMALMVAAVLRGSALDMGTSAVEAVEARRGIPDLSGLPHEVFPLLQYMLEPDPSHRPASMQDVAAMADDPTRIPVRYRMPLWRRAEAESPSLVTGSLGSHLSALGRDELTSDSPFGSAVQPVIQPPAQPVEATPRKLLVLPLAAGAAVLALVLVAWLVLGGGGDDVPPDPLDDTQVAADGGSAGGNGSQMLPPRDLTTREGFLADYDLGLCAQVQRIASGMDSGKLAALSDRALNTDPLLAAYHEQFAARPEVIANRVTPDQCAAVDFVRALQGRAEAPPVLSLDATTLIEGGTVAGRVREAQGRTLWLFLVAADGGLHDLSSRLVAQADGSFTFSFGLALQDLTEPLPQLIVALASRDPLVAPTTASAAARADQVLPRVGDEIINGGGFAAADIGFFALTPHR